MNTTTLLNVVAGVFGLAGSVVLAFSIDPVLRSLHAHVSLLDSTVDDLMSNGDIVKATGLDKVHGRSFRSSTWRVRIGCALLFLAFACQTVSAVWAG